MDTPGPHGTPDRVSVIERKAQAAAQMGEDSKPRGVKSRLSLTPLMAMHGVAAAFEYGARKGYLPGSWKHATADWAEAYGEAAMRHLMARLSGEVFDPESGLPHVYLAGANVLVMIWHEDRRLGVPFGGARAPDDGDPPPAQG